MKVVIIIPARFASTRYPGKPLVMLKGADGISAPLIEHSWRAASQVQGVDAVYVATDDIRIAECARQFGAEVVMTSEECRNGTERCGEAVERLGLKPDIVVNFQGDAPLTPTWFVEDLIEALNSHPQFAVATPVLRCDSETHAHFIEDRRQGRVGGTTAVFARDGRALYFSKEVIPYSAGIPSDGLSPVFHHVGVYAYRPDALAAYSTYPEGQLETLEGLEQIRFLENDEPLLCVEVKARGRVFWELNNPEDVARIEAVTALQ